MKKMMKVELIKMNTVSLRRFSIVERRKLFMNFGLDDAIRDKRITDAIQKGIGSLKFLPRGLRLEEDLNTGKDLRSIDAKNGNEKDDSNKSGEIDTKRSGTSPFTNFIDNIAEIFISNANIERSRRNVSSGIVGDVNLTIAIGFIEIDGLWNAFNAFENGTQIDALTIRKKIISTKIGLWFEGDFSAINTNNIVFADGANLFDDGEGFEERLVKDGSLLIDATESIIIKNVFRRTDTSVIDGEKIGRVAVFACPWNWFTTGKCTGSTTMFVWSR